MLKILLFFSLKNDLTKRKIDFLYSNYFSSKIRIQKKKIYKLEFLYVLSNFEKKILQTTKRVKILQ